MDNNEAKRRKKIRLIFVASLVILLASGLDLAWFQYNGKSLLHPYLDIFIVAACSGLAIVALEAKRRRQ